jgi:hypothetical protein
MTNKVKKSDIKTDYFCNHCNKFYASQHSLCNHNKKFHKIKVQEKTDNILNNSDNILKISDNILNNSDNILKISNNSLILSEPIIKQYNCRKCNKLFHNIKTRWSHEKICKHENKNENENELLKQEINELKDKINILLQSNKISPKTIKKINTQNNINNINNINNNINNTQNNINLTYVKFGNENLSELLSKKEMDKILSQVRLSIEESIKLVHFNDKRPQYKNVFITNMKDNLAYIFNGNKFQVESKDYVLYDLLNNHLGNIESYINDNNIEKTLKNKNLFQFIKEVNDGAPIYGFSNYKHHKLDKIKQFIYNNISY